MLNKKEILFDSSKITLYIDDYTGIFSDFDPRPYSKKALSDDFLLEAKRAAKERPNEKLELIFLMHKKKRRSDIETEVKKRLKQHFKKHYLTLGNELKQLKEKSMIIVFVGFLLMVLATYVTYRDYSNFVFYLLRIVFEPAGWFSVWWGLDQLFYSSKAKLPDYQFYKKMAKVDIKFMNY
ncbi:MAG: hypothetical protein NT139_01715 [Candidatus Woesearchaeota archaeon]|nr:hypothetical protein [Candidatus Woesearchaeota archaeon]